jgi:hypothetical protein
MGMITEWEGLSTSKKKRQGDECWLFIYETQKGNEPEKAVSPPNLLE